MIVEESHEQDLSIVNKTLVSHKFHPSHHKTDVNCGKEYQDAMSIPLNVDGETPKYCVGVKKKQRKLAYDPPPLIQIAVRKYILDPTKSQVTSIEQSFKCFKRSYLFASTMVPITAQFMALVENIY